MLMQAGEKGGWGWLLGFSEVLIPLPLCLPLSFSPFHPPSLSARLFLSVSYLLCALLLAWLYSLPLRTDRTGKVACGRDENLVLFGQENAPVVNNIPPL